MTVLSRSALEASPLADLHAIASELGVDGFRRLRREQLVDTILARQDGEAPEGGGAGEELVAVEGGDAATAAPRPRRRSRRRVRDADADGAEAEPAAA